MNGEPGTGLFSLEGKTIAVTGAIGQLGSCCSLTLASEGATVVGIDIFDEKSEKVKLLSGKIGNKFSYIQMDITDRGSIEKGFNCIKEQFGVPQVLINNAALDSPPGASVQENGPFETYPESSWEKVMNVNVKGVFLMCQIFGGAMAKEKKGSIINVSSIYGLVSPNQDIYEYRRTQGQPFFKPVAYSASKSALFNLTRYCATYWARANVRVNTVTFAGIYNNQDKNFLSEYCKRIPIGRMAKVEEYMGAFVFLSSEASSYMTGSNLIVDGGWTAW
jgi:NAD(P)-dependent dehydrogenase (short-subunit alcohol dehydrogenase family)